MQEPPHHYHVTASAEFDGNVALKTDDVPLLITAPPQELDGPGNQWSPETLLVGAVLNGFVFTFRSISHASGLEWSNLECSVEGVQERVDGTNRFTTFTIMATLTAPSDIDTSKAQDLLDRAQAVCPIAQSLLAETHLKTDIIIEP